MSVRGHKATSAGIRMAEPLLGILEMIIQPCADDLKFVLEGGVER